MHDKFYLENVHGRDHVEDLGVNGKIILKRILKKLDIRVWMDSSS
jgi:hypothetical protein